MMESDQGGGSLKAALHVGRPLEEQSGSNCSPMITRSIQSLLRQKTHIIVSKSPFSRVLTRAMSHRRSALDVTPPVNRGMTDRLDKDAFRKSVPILAVKVEQAKTGAVLRSKVLQRCDPYRDVRVRLTHQ